MKFARNELISISVFAAVGLAIWFGIPKYTEHIEAWDSIWYLLMFPAGFLAGLFSRRYYVHGAAALVGAQAIAFALEYVSGPGSVFGPLGLLVLAIVLGIVICLAWLGAHIRFRRRLGIWLLPLVLFLAARRAEAHTYYYQHGVSVGYPTEYDGDQIWQVTVLYDWSWNAVATGMMIHQPWFEGWRVVVWLHSPGTYYEVSNEEIWSWSPREVSVGLYFIWRAAVAKEPFYSPSGQLVPPTDGCTKFIDLNFGLCCDSHDVHYSYGGDRAHRQAVDNTFRECIRQRAQLWSANYGSVVSYLYWLGVRRFGCGFYTWTGRNPVTGEIDCFVDCDGDGAQYSLCSTACYRPYLCPALDPDNQ